MVLVEDGVGSRTERLGAMLDTRRGDWLLVGIGRIEGVEVELC